MALMTCPDCGKEHSDAAVACPNCGRPTVYAKPPVSPAALPKRISGCLVAVIIVVVLYLIGDAMGPSSSSTASSSSTPFASSTGTSTPAPEDYSPKLELVKWTWGEEYDYAIAEGQVKNISSESIRSVQAVVTFYDKNGEFITSDDALIDYNPILPAQTSPFKVMATWNPAMKKAGIEFKELMGGTIAHKSREKN
jgi:hypothetical protein